MPVIYRSQFRMHEQSIQEIELEEEPPGFREQFVQRILLYSVIAVKEPPALSEVRNRRECGAPGKSQGKGDFPYCLWGKKGEKGDFPYCFCRRPNKGDIP
jgi:hypothetical protein